MNQTGHKLSMRNLANLVLMLLVEDIPIFLGISFVLFYRTKTYSFIMYVQKCTQREEHHIIISMGSGVHQLEIQTSQELRNSSCRGRVYLYPWDWFSFLYTILHIRCHSLPGFFGVQNISITTTIIGTSTISRKQKKKKKRSFLQE